MTDLHAMQIRIPEDLYQRLRRAAFDRQMPMTPLIIAGIELKLGELDSGGNG